MKRRKRYSQVPLADKPTNLLPSGGLNSNRKKATGPINAEINQLLSDTDMYSSFSPSRVFEPEKVRIPYRSLQLPMMSPPKKMYKPECEPLRLSPSNRKKLDKLNHPTALLPSLSNSRTVVFLDGGIPTRQVPLLPKVNHSTSLEPIDLNSSRLNSSRVASESVAISDIQSLPPCRSWHRRSITLMGT